MFQVRKYVQFNDLVIDNYDMLASADLSGGFKTRTIPFSFTHGSYAPLKGRQQFTTEQSLSITLKLNTKKLTCDQRKFYKQYVQQNLLKAGRLWAVEGDQLLWTHAFVRDFSETYALEKHIVHMDIDLILYDGVWRKADPRKTFLQPYSVCRFEDIHHFRNPAYCADCCLDCLSSENRCPSCLSDCEFLNAENSLCNLHEEAINAFYNQCGDSFRIIHNCEVGFNIWGAERMLGHRLCKEDLCKHLIAGEFYSDTLLDSRDVTITLIGTFENPRITINGNTMVVEGEFDGQLTLNATGDMFYEPDACCPAKSEKLSIQRLEIPEGNSFGFVVRGGMNQVLVETNNCCDPVCIFIREARLTI